MNIYEKIANIQQKLKVPKDQFNKFGNYNYRNCEDILEAVKPLLAENKLLLILTDEICTIGDRYYVKAIATVIDYETENATVSNVAYAREEENKKGMDSSQVTGATSSYARKYALNGLFGIDDNKDADTNEFNDLTNDTPDMPKPKTFNKPKITLISEGQRKRLFAIGNGNNDVIKRVLERYGYDRTEKIKLEDYDKICTEVEAEINM